MSDYRIFILVVVGALLVDLVLATPLLVFGIVVFFYAIWLLYNLYKLETLFNNSESRYALASYNKLDNISRNISQLNKQIKTERSRSQRIISRFNEILRNFPHPTIMLNQYGEITWMDRNSAKFFKLRRKADIGIKLNNILRNATLGELLDCPQASELPITSPTNNDCNLLVSLSKLTNNIRIITVLDISTRVKLMNLQQEFISNASHELRTPLTVINGYLETLSLATTMDKRYQEMIVEAHNQAKLMTNVITDLLDLSTIENEQISSTTVNIAKVITKVIAECQPMLEQRKLSAQVDSTLTLITSFYQLYTLVKNLVDNAIKYTSSDGIIQIIVTKHTRISIAVVDNGIGIEKGQIELITQPFYRIHTTQKGSGLGLNIVEKIVAANNAQLQIDSKIGVGSTFTITF